MMENKQTEKPDRRFKTFFMKYSLISQGKLLDHLKAPQCVSKKIT